MTDTTDRPSSKVARLIDEHDLEGLGDELEARWTADGDDRMSLRDLADHFNKRLLERTLRDAEADAFDVDGIYDRLAGEEVSSGVRTETRTRLERDGVDVDRLDRQFVTYQAIRSYLQEYRDAEYEGQSDREKIKKDRRSIRRLMARTESVTQERIENLRDSGRFDLDQFEVFLDAQILCENCGTQHTVAELFEQQGCECQRE